MKQIAVFTRNHSQWLEEAVRISKHNPNATITFRARSEMGYRLARDSCGRMLPIYIAAVGSEGIVEYVAELCDGQLDPRRGNAKTEALLDAP